VTPLAHLQRDFADFLRDRSSTIRERIKGGPHADLDTLLGIYRNAYTGRLVGILREEFAKLRLLAGDRIFDDLAHAYLAAHPSTYFSVRWIGRDLAGFLATADPWQKDPGLAQIARIEWAETMAFDAADRPLVARDDLAAIPPTGWPSLILTLHASVQRVSISPEVFEIWKRLSSDEPVGPKPDEIGPYETHLVWRIGLDVKLRPLEADEADAIEAVAAGRTFAEICEVLAARVGADRAAYRAAELLERWVSTETIGRIDYTQDMSG
jgi:hypothetical protein